MSVKHATLSIGNYIYKLWKNATHVKFPLGNRRSSINSIRNRGCRGAEPELWLGLLFLVCAADGDGAVQKTVLPMAQPHRGGVKKEGQSGGKPPTTAASIP